MSEDFPYFLLPSLILHEPVITGTRQTLGDGAWELGTAGQSGGSPGRGEDGAGGSVGGQTEGRGGGADTQESGELTEAGEQESRVHAWGKDPGADIQDISGLR